MARYTGPIVFGAGSIVLIALFLLWKAIKTEPIPPATTGPRVTEVETGPAPVEIVPPTAPTPRARIPTLGGEPRKPSPSAEPSAPPSIDNDSPPAGTRLNTKNLEWGVAQMRAQVEANEPHVKECLNQAAGAAGSSGDATLTFIVAKRAGKYVIEETAVDHDQTTLQGDSLLECLHGTSKAMTFEGLPREAEAVFVTRTVKIVNGSLVENKMIKFSYIR